MKPLILLLTAVSLGFAADEAPRPEGRPDQATGLARPEGRPTPRFNGPRLSADEQKRLREAMEKAQQDPDVKEAHEQAAKAQQAAGEAQKKAREITDEAARKADPEVAPILEKIRKSMEQRPDIQPGRGPESQPRGDAPRTREGGNRQPNPEPGRFREGNREPNGNRPLQFPGLTPQEQQRVRDALAKVNADPAVREAREDAASAQRKAIETTEEAARKVDPSVGPLFDKMHKSTQGPR